MIDNDDLTNVYNSAVRDLQNICEEIAAYAVRGNLPDERQTREYDASKSLTERAWQAIVERDRTELARLRELACK